MMSRWILFIILILLGIALGLLYAWRVNPVQYTDTAPVTLRVDFKTDYVLMVAEIFSQEKNPELAIKRLSFLSSQPPTELVTQAINFAEKQLYAGKDLTQLKSLAENLKSFMLTNGTAQP